MMRKILYTTTGFFLYYVCFGLWFGLLMQRICPLAHASHAPACAAANLVLILLGGIGLLSGAAIREFHAAGKWFWLKIVPAWSVALLLAICLIAGCAPRVKNVTNLPTGTTLTEVQQWDSEVATLHKVAVAVSSLRQGIIGLEKAGAFPDTAGYVKALSIVGKMDQLELDASGFLRQQPQHFGATEKQKIADYVKQIGAHMEELQSLAGIKNADTQKAFAARLTDVQAALTLALTLTN